MTFNPLTDKITFVPLSDGRMMEVRQPGAIKNQPSQNWRFKRETFIIYRPYLQQALANWPAETSFAIPPDMSPNTFVRCLRDARQAVLENLDYDPELRTRFLERTSEGKTIADSVAISMDPSGQLVWFRAKHDPGRQRKADRSAVVSSIKRPTLAAADSVQELPSLVELTAFCTLISAGRLHGPLHFRGRIDAQTQEAITSSFDVAFAFDELTNITTML